MTGHDPLLEALQDARNHKEQADHAIRVLLAYARELTPRPYRLADLAAAAGMSISGVRTAYTPRDVESARQMIAAPETAHHGQNP